MGFNQGGTQQIASNSFNKSSINNKFNYIYSSQLFLIIISILPLYLILLFYKKKYFLNFEFIHLIVLYFILSSSLPCWFFNGIEKVQLVLIVQIYPKLFGLISILFFIKNPNDYIIYFVFLIIGLIISIIHMFYVLLFNLKINFIINNPLRKIKENFNYFLTSFSKTVGANLLPFFLVTFTSLEILGLFSLADRIKGAILIIINPILQACFPRMCKLYKNNQSEYSKILKKYSTLIFY